VEPRVVDFYTDSLGFRNRQDYQGQAFVLFGDSFAAGTANTQDATLSEILTHTHGIPVYNAAYPAGEIRDYIARLHFVEKAHGADFGAIIVAFEGNDFRCSGAHRIDRGPRWHRVYEYIPSFVRELESYRVLYGLTRRLYHLYRARERVDEDLTVLVERYGGKEVAFLKSYSEKATDPEACTWEEQRGLFESVADRISLMVFMPTKYRVYGSLAASGRKPLPSSPSSTFMRELARDLSIPFLDLTPALVAASEKLLAEGRYTFWRDDTHWNPDGMRAAADAIAEKLRDEALVPRDVDATPPPR
jgi:catechol 2,3-dioxygenase-like lactoylglutathione lyase family enzyme